jgi:hypothetical protein
MVNAQAAPTPRRQPASLIIARVRVLLALVLVQVVSGNARADAGAPSPALTHGSSGMRGLTYTGLPLTVPELTVGGSAGYGVTESLAKVPGANHRVQGGLAVALAPLDWLAFALRFDGRLELHPDDGRGSHNAGFGDPRLLARAGHALGSGFSLGAELGVWFPGSKAPSIVPSATSLEGRALLAYEPEASPWTVLAALGARLDNSANAAPDLKRLRVGDRISLGLSDSNALLAALGLARRIERITLFGELAADVLVGSRAPAFLDSPLRAVLGGRYAWSPTLESELTLITSLSKRPAIGASDPLVPIEPRFIANLALRWTLPLTAAKPVAVTPTVAPPLPQTIKTKTPPKVQNVAVSGTLTDDQGQPLPEASVRLEPANGPALETISDAQGHYHFEAVPVGPAQLQAAAVGFGISKWQLEVQPDLPVQPPRALSPKTDSGLLRGLVRSFASEPLRAQLRVRDKRGRLVANGETAADGRIELELSPGRYTVTITSHGYRTFEQDVRIEGNGVSVLNADMRAQ